MRIQYLCSVYGKNEVEIKDFLIGLNIKGDILVGNQNAAMDAQYEIMGNGFRATIFNMTGKGVSKNRNFLLKKASAKYVTFLDDDAYMVPGNQETIDKTLDGFDYPGIRFNVESDNADRPNEMLKTKGPVGFRKLSGYGCWGCFFDREFLLENGLFFAEDMGPGTNINHGEDTLFLKRFTEKSKIYSYPNLGFRIRQSESTWQGNNRKVDEEIFAHGFLYSRLYKSFPRLLSLAYALTHKKYYPKGTKASYIFKGMKIGIKAERNIHSPASNPTKK